MIIWHKWPDEKPPSEGTYLIHVYGDSAPHPWNLVPDSVQTEEYDAHRGVWKHWSTYVSAVGSEQPFITHWAEINLPEKG